jgi:hypothetical protein
VDFHNFKRFVVKDHPLRTREDLMKQLSSFAGQTQNMSNLDFFTRQLAFGLSTHDSSLRPITKHFYVPGLMKEGFGLKQIQELSNFDLEFESASKIEQLRDNPLLRQKLEAIREGYEQTKNCCGKEIADVVLDNAKHWVSVVTSHATSMTLQNPSLRQSASQMQQPEPMGMAAGPSNHQDIARPQVYLQRQNKDPRAAYPPLLKSDPSSSLKRLHPNMQDPIPRKRRSVEAPKVGDVQAEQGMALLSRDMRQESVTRPDFQELYQTAFGAAGALFRDMFKLLEPRHFGAEHSMGLPEIRQAFRQRVLDQVGSRRVSSKEMSMLVKKTILDLLST